MASSTLSFAVRDLALVHLSTFLPFPLLHLSGLLIHLWNDHACSHLKAFAFVSPSAWHTLPQIFAVFTSSIHSSLLNVMSSKRFSWVYWKYCSFTSLFLSVSFPCFIFRYRAITASIPWRVHSLTVCCPLRDVGSMKDRGNILQRASPNDCSNFCSIKFSFKL